MPSNPTPAEIARLTCRIAEGVMGWTRNPQAAYLWNDNEGHIWLINNGDDEQDWWPWDDPAAALEVLERLLWKYDTQDYRILRSRKGFNVNISRGLTIIESADAPGPHFGPAVCLLAEKFLSQ